MRAWLQAARLPSAVNLQLPLLFGQTLAYATYGAVYAQLCLLLALYGLAMQLFIVFLNDWADKQADVLNETPTLFSGGSRVLVERRIEPTTLLRAGLFSGVAVLALGLVELARPLEQLHGGRRLVYRLVERLLLPIGGCGRPVPASLPIEPIERRDCAAVGRRVSSLWSTWAQARKHMVGMGVSQRRALLLSSPLVYGSRWLASERTPTSVPCRSSSGLASSMASPNNDYIVAHHYVRSAIMFSVMPSFGLFSNAKGRKNGLEKIFSVNFTSNPAKSRASQAKFLCCQFGGLFKIYHQPCFETTYCRLQRLTMARPGDNSTGLCVVGPFNLCGQMIKKLIKSAVIGK